MGIPMPAERRKPNKTKKLSLKGATGNNLKNVSVDVPLGHVRRHHRGFGRRQVDADDRHHVPGDRAAAERRARGPCPA